MVRPFVWWSVRTRVAMADEAEIQSQNAEIPGLRQTSAIRGEAMRTGGEPEGSSGEGCQGARVVGIRAHSVSRSSRVIKNSRTNAERERFLRASGFKLN